MPATPPARLTVILALLSSGPEALPQSEQPSSRSITLDEPRSTKSSAPPGLFASFRSTRDAGIGLAKAHIDLAKAEFSAIKGEITRVLALAGIAIAVVLFALILVVIGTSMFLGEWLLGSIGWGVLHGTLLFAAIAIACTVAALGVSSARIGRAFIAAVILGVIVGVGLALALPNRAYRSIGESTLPTVEAGVRPLVVGMIVVGVVGLVIGVIAAFRASGAGARVSSIVGSALVGVVLGAISAIETGVQVGAAIGITAGYLVWIALMAMDIARSGVDTDALKARFYPSQTIETSKETLAWLQSKMPPGTGS
jgi:hypothetical protein